MIIETNHLANAVLAYFRDMAQEDEENTFIVTPYENGREHGWAISSSRLLKQVCFAEFRRSDDIVVYFGHSSDFNPQGNIPNEDVYNNKAMLPYEQAAKAAAMVLDFLIDTWS